MQTAQTIEAYNAWLNHMGIQLQPETKNIGKRLPHGFMQLWVMQQLRCTVQLL